VAKQPLDSKFTLAHIGSFLSERNPLILWESLAELSAEIPDFKSHLEIKLMVLSGSFANDYSSWVTFLFE
jgi:hypothetical protein